MFLVEEKEPLLPIEVIKERLSRIGGSTGELIEKGVIHQTLEAYRCEEYRGRMEIMLPLSLEKKLSKGGEEGVETALDLALSVLKFDCQKRLTENRLEGEVFTGLSFKDFITATNEGRTREVLLAILTPKMKEAFGDELVSTKAPEIFRKPKALSEEGGKLIEEFNKLDSMNDDDFQFGYWEKTIKLRFLAEKAMEGDAAKIREMLGGAETNFKDEAKEKKSPLPSLSGVRKEKPAFAFYRDGSFKSKLEKTFADASEMAQWAAETFIDKPQFITAHPDFLSSRDTILAFTHAGEWGRAHLAWTTAIDLSLTTPEGAPRETKRI